MCDYLLIIDLSGLIRTSMSSHAENVVVISDDTFVIDLIESVLSGFAFCKLHCIGFQDFKNDQSLVKNDTTAIIDETLKVSESLSINMEIKSNYPNIKLIVISPYPNGDFDSQFKNSGADYVIEIGKLHTQLLQICEDVSEFG